MPDELIVVLVILGILLVIALILLAVNVKVIGQTEKGIIERFGALVSTLWFPSLTDSRIAST